MKKAAKKAAGRPKDLKKQEAIINAALRHFLERGFERAGMDAIADKAGVSKLTLYSHFGNKDGLFQAIVARKCGEVKLSDDFTPLLALPPKAALTQIGRRFLSLIFQPEVIAMQRMVISEAATKPKISKLVYEAGPEKVKKRLAELFAEFDRRGQLSIDDAWAAMCHFLILLKGERHYLCLFNLAKPPTEKEKEQHLADCVNMFLRAYAPRNR